MKKFLCLSVILLVAAASVNAAVTVVPTRPMGALTIDNGLPVVSIGMNVQRTGTHLGNPGSEYDVVNQNFRLGHDTALSAFAIQLGGTGYSSGNVHISTSNTATSRAPYVKMRVEVWQYTGAAADLIKYYAEPSNQQDIGGTTPITHWSKLGTVIDWPTAVTSLDTDDFPLVNPKDGWIKFDLSTLGLSLTAGTQYAVSLGFDKTMASSQGIRVAYTYTTPGAPAATAPKDPGFMFGRSKSMNPFLNSDGVATTFGGTPYGGYTGPGINPATGLWEDTFGAFGDGYRVNYSSTTGLGAQTNFVVIPEPATIALLSIGGLLLRRRFSK